MENLILEANRMECILGIVLKDRTKHEYADAEAREDTATSILEVYSLKDSTLIASFPRGQVSYTYSEIPI
jgi:hypothetical protein